MNLAGLDHGYTHIKMEKTYIVETLSNLTKDVEYYFTIEATVQEGLPPITSALRPFSKLWS